MIKLDKKGFTLIELLIVIAILSIVMSIAVPSIISSVERAKEKQKEKEISLIKSYSEIYIDNHKNSLEKIEKITIEMLYQDKLLTKDELEDPLDNSKYICGYVPYENQQLGEFIEDSSYCLE